MMRRQQPKSDQDADVDNTIEASPDNSTEASPDSATEAIADIAVEDSPDNDSNVDSSSIKLAESQVGEAVVTES